MRHRLSPISLLIGLFAIGCTPPAATTPALQPNDVVRPEVSFAPAEPWKVGDRVTVGVLLQGERPDGTGYYILDQDVDIERVTVNCRLTFANDDKPVGDVIDVTMEHDC